MSPTQYRALEALEAAHPGGLLIAAGLPVPAGRAHPRTADALVRRGLATVTGDLGTGEEVLRITQAGRERLAAPPASPMIEPR